MPSVEGGLASCTGATDFANSYTPPRAEVSKITDPAGSEDEWTFTLSGPGLPESGVPATTSGTGFVAFLGNLGSGAYTITETSKAGWDLTDVTGQVEGSLGSGTAVGTRPICTLQVDEIADANGVFKCTFTNTLRGKIILKKKTEPPGRTGFHFTGDVATSLDDGQQFEVDDVVPGGYTTTESERTGWDNSNIGCDDGQSETPSTFDVQNSTATFNVDPGETVSCEFTNTSRGKIVLLKKSVPAGGTGFTFTGDVAGTINDGGDTTLDNVVAGDYTSTESAEPGWYLSDLDCDDDQSATPITVDPETGETVFNVEAGETVTCTYTNTQLGTIIVEKQTQPAGGKAFPFTGDAAGTIDDDQAITVPGLKPGNYSSTEAAKTGWDLSSISCDDSDSSGHGDTANFVLAAGETLRCTFNNTQRATIIVEKQTLPDGNEELFHSQEMRRATTASATATRSPSATWSPAPTPARGPPRRAGT